MLSLPVRRKAVIYNPDSLLLMQKEANAQIERIISNAGRRSLIKKKEDIKLESINTSSNK